MSGEGMRKGPAGAELCTAGQGEVRVTGQAETRTSGQGEARAAAAQTPQQDRPVSRPAWTSAQRAAITARGGPLLVSAAAGSGKTAVLTERAVRLLCEGEGEGPVPADRLLIVTFTNAAAAEMRARISRRLYEEQLKNPAGPARRQRMLLQRAPICTIDAFCLDLLQKHFSALEIPPDFSPAEEGELFALRQETLAAVLETAYADPDFCAFADLYGRSRTDAAAGQAVLEVYDFLRALPAPMASLEGFCAVWAGGEPLGATPWGAGLLEAARRTAGYARRLADAALGACRRHAALSAYLPALESDTAALCALETVLAAGSWQAGYDAVHGFAFARLGALRGAGEADRARAEEVKALRERVKKLVGELQKDIFVCTEAEFEADRAAAAPLAAALARAVRAFDQAFFAAKLEKKLLEFSDFEHLTLRLLQNPDGSRTALSEQVSAGFAAVMVDEYQDTNALQDAIYRCLAKQDGSNLFLVGDVKQSIYRFRQADPGVFLEKLDRFAPLGGGWPARLALDANFRSAPEVIRAVNFFFGKLMSRQLGGVEYGPGQRLVPGGGDGSYPGQAGLLLAKSHVPAGDAGVIASRIRKMVDEGFLVREKDGSLRCARYEDFCIILRARSHFEQYAAALEAEGIPACADTAGNLLEEGHIRPLAALLRVLDNPAQDVPLAAVMLSGLAGFTPDDLVRLRAECRDGSLYGALAVCARRAGEAEQAAPKAGRLPQTGGPAQTDEQAGPGKPDAAEDPGPAAPQDDWRARCAAFYRQLAGLRRLARTLPAGQLLQRLLAETGYLAAVGAEENGPRRREDVLRFVAFAASAAGQSGLSGLVRAMDAAQRGGGLPGQGAAGAGPRPGCVLIMTVHRSKGLEFPVVFVADAARRFNLTDLNRPVLCHARLGLGFALRGANGGGGLWPTAAHRAIRQALRQEALSEEMRVLYVAFTRARDALFITLPLADPAGAVQRLALPGFAAADAGALLRAASPAVWLLAAALCHPGGGLRAAAGLEPAAQAAEDPARDAGDGQAVQNAGQLAVSLIDEQPKQQAPSAAAGPLLTCAPDEELLARLRQLFGWQYPRAALTRVPAKVSVTALVHREEEPAAGRPAFLAADGLSAAEKGTALHAFLQHADLLAAAKDPEAEAGRQLRMQLLAPELAARLDYAALRAFFKSSLFARICSAGQLLREYDFITALPAAAAAADKTADYAGAEVLVQGVADLVLVNEAGAEIVDYKTDRGKTPAQLLRAYRGQLMLYARAIEKRLGLPVRRCTLYSFALGAEVDVPLTAR